MESIHHTDWPEADTAIINEKRLSQMGLARRVASLGLNARRRANLKVRQPLAKVFIHVSQGKAEFSSELVEIIADELNVKALEFVKDAGTLVSYKVLPNNKLLGHKFGAEFPKVEKHGPSTKTRTSTLRIASQSGMWLLMDLTKYLTSGVNISSQRLSL